MPENREHDVQIAELRARVDAHDEVLQRHDENIGHLNDFMVELRNTLATKDDISALREDLRSREALHERFDNYRDRLAEMESEGSERRDEEKHEQGMTINRIVVGLFVGELVIEAMQLWLMVRHG
jgi:hypothetical protein